jgi:hypothetical protein
MKTGDQISPSGGYIATARAGIITGWSLIRLRRGFMSGLFDFDHRNGLFGLLETKRKVFISYHHGGDRAYYDALSRTFCDQYEVFHDTSLERAIDSDNTDYVRWRLAEKCITGSSCTIVLIGRETWGRKFVDWEIDATLERGHGLIGLMLPAGGLGLLS